jgi:hypothetical protein
MQAWAFWEPSRSQVLVFRAAVSIFAGPIRFVPDAALVHGLVPQPPAAVPLGEERPLGLRAGAQPVGVADGFLHARHYPVHPRHFRCRATRGTASTVGGATLEIVKQYLANQCNA